MIHSSELRLLRILAAIVEARSIRGAAERLGIGAPVVSAALKALEERLAVTLVTRTTRSFALTQAGEAVYAHARAMVEAGENALAVFDGPEAEIDGEVSLTLPSELAAFWIAPVLQQLSRQVPGLTTRISADDSIVDLASSHHELAIRTARIPTDAAPDRSELTRLALALVAAPGSEAFEIAQKGTADAVALPYILFRSGQAVLEGTKAHTGDPVHIPLEIRFSVDNQFVAKELALRGFGAALMIRPTVEDAVSEGSLMTLFDDIDFGHISLRVVMRDLWPSRPAQAVRNALARHCASES